MSYCCGEKCTKCGGEIKSETVGKCGDCGEDKYVMRCSGTCGAAFDEHNCG